MADQPDKFSTKEMLGNMQEVVAEADTVVTSTLQKVKTMKEVVEKGTASGDIFSDKRIGQIRTCEEALGELKEKTAEVGKALTTGPAVSGAPAGLTR
jgi:hypothetical protein